MYTKHERTKLYESNMKVILTFIISSYVCTIRHQVVQAYEYEHFLAKYGKIIQV